MEARKLRKRARVTEVPSELPKVSVKTNDTTGGDNHTDKKLKQDNNSSKPYTRGESLSEDLKVMIDNPLYSDIIIICKDDKELHACKLLLAARSEYFNKLLFSSQQQESSSSHLPNKITVSELTSSAVKAILEYLYTGNVSWTIDIVSDAYNGATFFFLPQLKVLITGYMKSYMKKHHNVGTSNQIAKILSKIADNSIATVTSAATSSSDDGDNQLIGEICKFLMSTSLHQIDYQNLSSKALEYLLSHTLNMKEGKFATTEFDVFRYCILWAVNQISKNDVIYFKVLLPSNEELDKQQDSGIELDPIDTNSLPLKQHRTTIMSILNSILNSIDFRLINPNILAKIIEPLEIVKPSILTAAYRYQAQLADSSVQTKRGAQE